MRFSHFERYSELAYGFSTRRDGSMHRHLQKENRATYFKRMGIDPDRVAAADLVHGTRVWLVSEKMAGTMAPDTDALITQQNNLFLSVTGADVFRFISLRSKYRRNRNRSYRLERSYGRYYTEHIEFNEGRAWSSA